LSRRGSSRSGEAIVVQPEGCWRCCGHGGVTIVNSACKHWRSWGLAEPNERQAYPKRGAMLLSKRCDRLNCDHDNQSCFKMRVDFRRGAMLFTLPLWRGNKPFIIQSPELPYHAYSLSPRVGNFNSPTSRVKCKTQRQSCIEVSLEPIHVFPFPILLITHALRLQPNHQSSISRRQKVHSKISHCTNL